MAKRGRNETPKHKIEKFDVRQFMGVLERSKVAHYSSFRGSLYFSSLTSRGLSAVDFCRRALPLPRCLSLKLTPSSTHGLFPVFLLTSSLSYRFATCAMIYRESHRSSFSVSRLKSPVLSNFHAILLTRYRAPFPRQRFTVVRTFYV